MARQQHGRVAASRIHRIEELLCKSGLRLRPCLKISRRQVYEGQLRYLLPLIHAAIGDDRRARRNLIRPLPNALRQCVGDGVEAFGLACSCGY